MSAHHANFRTLDLNLLKVFDAVMLERNVTRAAARLAMTQPAVSNALRRLREAMNEELFVPSPTGMAPTAYALTLWQTVRESLGHLHDAIEPQGFDARSEARNFTLTMADATAALFVPALVALLQQQGARVDLRVAALTSRDPRAMLEQGRADVAVGFFPEVQGALAAEGPEAPMALEPLYSCEYVCVMRADHALAAPHALTADSYCAAQHLRVNFSGRPRGFVDAALARVGRKRRVLITVNDFYTAGISVAQSDLLTVLPRSFVATLAMQGELAVRALPFEMPAIDVALLWHRRHEVDAAQRWLRDTVAQASARVAAVVRAAA